MNLLLYKYRYLLAFSMLFIIYLINMFLDVMEIDAAQYASISREMSETKSFLQVYERGRDYLDKPPLLFWLSSLSFLALGVSNFSYKLPSVLILLLGLYSTYRFTLFWYDKQRALYASLILASCQAYFLITNDVRTDGNLLGLVIFAVWQLSVFIEKAKWHNLFLGALGVGGAMLAKGPIGIVVPAFAVGAHLIYKHQWKQLFNWKWLFFLILVAIVLVPMCIGLYLQFDLHPEKIVYNLQGPSGLKFFFWTQSFGRITGEIYWNNHAPFYFFLTTILWDFQPWILLFIPALIKKTKDLILEKFKSDDSKEYMSFFGFILVFLALSSSQYKLPHYIFVIFPFAAVITADFLCSINEKQKKFIKKFQFYFMQLFVVAIVIGYSLFFYPENYFLIFTLLLFVLIGWLIFLKKTIPSLEKIILTTISISVAFNFFLAAHLYPNLLKYQTQNYAGKFAKENKLLSEKFYVYKVFSHGVSFYAHEQVKDLDINELHLLKNETIIYTNEEGYREISSKDSSIQIFKELKHYHVTSLTLNFLMNKTRNKVVEKRYLLKKSTI